MGVRNDRNNGLPWPLVMAVAGALAMAMASGGRGVDRYLGEQPSVAPEGTSMVYRATEEVVQRVMPLLELLAHRTIDKARLLQYLSAQAGIDWGVLEPIEERIEPG